MQTESRPGSRGRHQKNGSGDVTHFALSSDGKTLTLIPYQETAGYVVKVQKAYEMYRHLYGDQTQLSH